MKPYRLSPKAAADLEDIWDYTQAQWGDEQAANYVREIANAIQTIADNRRRGRPIDHIRPGYFKLSTGAHVVFYRLTDGELDVVRILHQRMDFDRHL